MRHTAHLMLGGNAEHIAKSIKQYAIKYGNQTLNEYLKILLYKEDDQKNAAFRTSEIKPVDDSVFVAGIDGMYDVEFSKEYQIPSDLRQEYIKGFFRDLYDNSVTINHPGDSRALHLCVYLPLYKKEYWQLVKEMLSAIEGIQQQYCVDLFLLPYDLAFLFETDVVTLPERISEYSKCTSDILKTILDEKKTYPSLSKLLMVQNCNADGLSLELNADSFVRITGEYAILSVSNYPEMYPASAQDPNRPIHALGISVLSFDKFYFVQYLLHKAYAYILDREKVSQPKVEVNKVSQIVHNILTANVSIFSRFYEKEIVPLLNNNVNQSDIISQVEPKLRLEIERLTKEFQSYIEDPELSLPEKKATLAQLTGEDDELLVGYLLNKKQLVIDDCSREVLDLFVQANNALCVIQSKKNEDGENKDGVSFMDYATLSDEGEPVKMASVLLDELKSTKVAMRESTTYIRLKSEELEGLDIQKKEHKESKKRLTKGGFVFEGYTYRLQGDIEERSLEDVYEPTEKVALGSVDLRHTFTEVKDQGNMGACTAFAMVAIFESILKKNKQDKINLSEKFVYYNARKRESKVISDSGCSLYAAVHTMAEEGVCREDLCQYDPEDITSAPSEAAYEDAKERRIVKAMNVKKDINAIRSALADGYPVAISLKIFDSFNPNKGFISTPSEDEISSSSSGNHAMVICGYNDEACFFVVRNSWGHKFGVQGYCYIPYAYIGNTDLLNNACIITNVSNSNLKVKDQDQKTVVAFDLTDSNIKSEILNNLIGQEKIKLRRLSQVLTERSTVFNTIFQHLGNNSNRETICEGTQKRLEYECMTLRDNEAALNEERIHELNHFDSKSRRYRWGFWIYIAVVVISLIISAIAEKSFDVFWNKWTLIFSYGLNAILGLIFWLVMRRRKRQRKDIDMDYKVQLQQVASQIASRVAEKNIIHLKCHVAGMIIDSLYKLTNNLHTKYSGMASYVGNLKVWREQEILSMNMSPCVRDPFLTLISNETLDKYFESQKGKITEGIALSKMFKDKYKVDESEIIKFKNKLKNDLVYLLFEAVKDFSIFKYVTKDEVYPYVDDLYTNIDVLLQQMDIKSNPFVRLNPTVADSSDINTYCKVMLLHTSNVEDRKRWEDACSRDFRNKPVLCRIEESHKVTLVQLKALSPESISII